jgi:hypothetical protein
MCYQWSSMVKDKHQNISCQLFFSCKIFGFIRIMWFLMVLPLTFKSVFPWCVENCFMAEAWFQLVGTWQRECAHRLWCKRDYRRKKMISYVFSFPQMSSLPCFKASAACMLSYLVTFFFYACKTYAS